MGRLLLVLAITAGLAFPGKASGALWSKRAPGKFLVYESKDIFSARFPFVNSRYIIWKGEGDVLSYDLLTKKTISVERNWMIEMRGENCIYLGTSHCCWINVAGGGSNAWDVFGGHSFKDTSRLLSSDLVASKEANIHECYVAFNEQLKSYVVDLSNPELEKTLLTDSSSPWATPTVSHRRVAYSSVNDEVGSDVYVYDIEKKEPYKISVEGVDNGRAIITKDYVFYYETTKNSTTIKCYNLGTKETINVSSTFKGSAYLINNPDSDLLVIALNSSKGKMKLACYDPLFNKTIDITGEADIEGKNSLSWASSCSQGRRIVYAFGNNVMMAEIGERGEVATYVIDGGETKRTDIRVFCTRLYGESKTLNEKCSAFMGTRLNSVPQP